MLKLYVGERATTALIVLHQCAQPAGVAYPLFKRRVFRRGRYHMIAEELSLAGLTEQRASGPRGGKRWHTTPLGNQVLYAVDHHPAPHVALMLLGFSPKKLIGKNFKRNPGE